MWETFGPKQEGSKALRPFGDVALDGFDFDFEANVQHMAPFANELRSLMEADKSKQKFYLTAAPQCPYPDQADKEILNGPVYIDAIWVQFYNNFCGVNNFNADPASSKYNFDEWDNWAKTVSKNPDVKVIVGVPAFTTAASTGYIPASQLDEVIQYSKKFESFGGVMLWDATQAYGNDGFIKDVRKSLGPADDDSGSSSPDTASTSAPAPTSTDSTKTNPNPNPTTKTETPTSTKTKTSPSSSAPDSSLSSASSESATVSPKEPEATTTAETKPTTTASETKPTNTASETKPINTASETKPTTITTQAKPTTAPTTTAPPAPSTTEAKPVKSTTAEPETSSTTVPEPAPAPTTTSTPEDADESDDDDSQSDKDDGSQDDDDDYDYLSNVLGNDIIGLLGGLRQANKVAGGVTHGLTKNLRRAQRSRI